MHRIDTAPGFLGPFSPPHEWSGDADAYRALMRDRYRNDPAARQQMGAVARRRDLVAFLGPWAGLAEEIVDSIADLQSAKQ